MSKLLSWVPNTNTHTFTNMFMRQSSLIDAAVFCILNANKKYCRLLRTRNLNGCSSASSLHDHCLCIPLLPFATKTQFYSLQQQSETFMCISQHYYPLTPLVELDSEGIAETGHVILGFNFIPGSWTLGMLFEHRTANNKKGIYMCSVEFAIL